MTKDLVELERVIDVKFGDINLLQEALTHRSFLNEKRAGDTHHNERLEFLGDAVLELAVTRFLFDEFPEKTEGDLTSLRASLVNSNMLFQVADKLKLHLYIRLSKGEAKDSGKGRHFILANAMEALIGAIYLDRGYETSDTFVRKHICSNMGNILKKKLWQDSKSVFQEKAQEKDGITPVYKVVEESGPDHEKYFVVGAYLGNELVAKGEGLSKQEAERAAAEKALSNKKWDK
ncbi:ribonuclease III [Patescibacteria group bacterium]|nr:ribonuclease III [Patescibacteria group bacterium]MBU2633525.1 ribonuclease III [Patescibacteria group bacterium]